MSMDPIPTNFAMFVLGVLAFFLIMLLPALLELKRPKDAGPRRILEDSASNPVGINLASLERTEEKSKLNLDLAKRIAEALAVLPNLET